MNSWLESVAKYDDLSIILGTTLALAYAFAKWVSPTSLVHPLLLGRQSEVERVRSPGESAIYRNYGTGSLGILPSRPARDVQLTVNLLKQDFQQPRRLWGVEVTNETLQTRSTNLAKGLVSRGLLQPGDSKVLVLLNDSVEWVITDLALSKVTVPSLAITSLEFLGPVLRNCRPSAIICHADLLSQLSKLITESQLSSHKVIVVGQAEKQVDLPPSISVISWDEIVKTGEQSSVELPVPKPSDVVTISFHNVLNGVPQGTKLTHENIVAGVTAVRVLPPLNELFKPEDSIYSAFAVTTAIGRAILYAALYEGTHFTTTQSIILDPPYNLRTPRDSSDLVGTMNSSKTPPPTVFFGDSSHAESVTRDVLNEAKSSSPFFDLACRHKFQNLEDGYLSNTSFWDKYIFSSPRKFALGKAAGTLRLMVVADPIINAGMLPIQVAFSLPLVRILSHPAVCGPICASHGYDLQYFPEKGNASASAHVGPPSANIEVKLSGVDEAAIEKGSDPMGELLFRGPTVGRTVPTNEEHNAETSSDDSAGDRWYSLHRRASVRSNGTFIVFDS